MIKDIEDICNDESMAKDALGISENLPKKPSFIGEKDALGQGDT